MVNIYLQKPYQIIRKKKSNSPIRLFQAENILHLAGTKAPKKEEVPGDEFTTFQPKADQKSPEGEFNLQGNSIYSNFNNLTNRTD